MENSLIKDIGRSYIVSSLLPAAFFVSVGVLVFRGYIPSVIIQRVIEQDQYYGAQWLLYASFVIWVAFCLYSATDWTVRLFEGYYIPKFFRKRMAQSLRKWHRRKTKKIRKALKYKESGDFDYDEYFDNYYPAALTQYQHIEKIMPLEEEHVMPTRFGNILLASEIYAEKTYYLDGLNFWTRLIHVIPENFKSVMEEKNNQMIFLLNSALLSYIIGALSLIVGVLNLPCQLFWDASLCIAYQNSLTSFFGPERTVISPIAHIFIGLIFLVIGYVVYRFSLLFLRQRDLDYWCVRHLTFIVSICCDR